MGLGRLELPTSRLSAVRFNLRQEATYLSKQQIRGNPEQPANLLTDALGSLMVFNGKQDGKRTFPSPPHMWTDPSLNSVS